MKKQKHNPEKKREVLTRFTEKELDAMKRDTGADKDGAAVAAFVRKRFLETV